MLRLHQIQRWLTASWHATKMSYYNKNIGDIACQLQAYVCPMLFCVAFLMFDSSQPQLFKAKYRKGSNG